MHDLKLKIAYLIIAVLAGFLVAGSFSFGFFSGLENYFEDLLVFAKPVNSDIVIAAIDNESIQKIGQWPWPRRVFSEAFSGLESNPPKVVGIDVIFSEPSRIGEIDDSILAEGLKKISYPVVMPVEAVNLTIDNGLVSSKNFLKPLTLFEGIKNISFGHVNLILDRDGIARKLPLKVDSFESFAYEVAKKSDESLVYASQENIGRIVYSSPSGSIRRVPFWRLLEEDRPDLKNKVVLIGATAPDLHDEKPTPFSLGTEMPGVEIQANILNMFLSDYHLFALSNKSTVLWIFLTAILAAVIFMLFSSSLAAVLVNIVFGIFYVIIIAVLFEKGLAANIIHINLGWLISTASLFSYKYFSVEKERREIKSIFSKYVSKDVLEDILRNPSEVKLGGEEKEVTVLFSEIQ